MNDMKKLICLTLSMACLCSGCVAHNEETVQKPVVEQETGIASDGEVKPGNESAVTSDTKALIPKPMALNAVTQNPYMSKSENSVHNDSYSSDVSNAVLPLGIDDSLSLSLETKNPQAPSAAFYDEHGSMITPFNGGIAIADMTEKKIGRKGIFVPAVHDDVAYRVQISYSFVDKDNNVVLPTSHGHVIILQTRGDGGEILPVFRKVLDVNVAEAAKKVLGEDIDTRLLSIVYDYDGNLWFVTGGFRIVPEQNPAGFLGYLSREYIDKVMKGEEISAEDYLYFYKLTEGESAENGISSGEHGAVILTNKSCYQLTAKDGVEVQWKVDYESNGTNDAVEGSQYTGGGLAYGGGSTPTLTKDLVLFTDNLDPVNLIAIEAATGKTVAKVPVLDGLGKDVPVSVENSILVYSGSAERASVIVCNWFGAGNAGLSDPDSDSSIQTYANIYDQNWMQKGSNYLAPGVERVDIVKEGNEYKAEKVWFRDDIRDTSMMKLSTATGYVYGYWQNMDTNMWCYEVLDFADGKTVCEVPVSDLPAYNNVAVGMINDVRGNALYCPTNSMEMACWQDNFVYLPNTPAKVISPHAMERAYIPEEYFKEKTGKEMVPKSYLMKANVGNLPGETIIAFKLNGLTGKVSAYDLFYEKADGSLALYEGEWKLCNETGEILSGETELQAEQLVEVRFACKDGNDQDLNKDEKDVKVSVILGMEE